MNINFADRIKQLPPYLFEEIDKAKQKAMECYQFEKRAFPHPRSPKALEIYASNQVEALIETIQNSLRQSKSGEVLE